uniref:Uncharacterized protein n=1 Tax=Heterorhabditis bacteriophora TaxID=37862 RepID=A0A1I7WTN1_HETBA
MPSSVLLMWTNFDSIPIRKLIAGGNFIAALANSERAILQTGSFTYKEIGFLTDPTSAFLVSNPGYHLNSQEANSLAVRLIIRGLEACAGSRQIERRKPFLTADLSGILLSLLARTNISVSSSFGCPRVSESSSQSWSQAAIKLHDYYHHYYYCDYYYDTCYYYYYYYCYCHYRYYYFAGIKTLMLFIQNSLKGKSLSPVTLRCENDGYMVGYFYSTFQYASQ